MGTSLRSPSDCGEGPNINAWWPELDFWGRVIGEFLSSLIYGTAKTYGTVGTDGTTEMVVLAGTTASEELFRQCRRTKRRSDYVR